ncbi:MAG: hypothetical protein ACPG45_09040 [Flavobacteriaceae bacterium]|jgi:hypothetical protein
MQQQEKIFADGFSFKRNENAPDFVVGRMSIKVEDAVVWMKSNAKNGWVNLDVKLSKSGKYYCELDTWEAKPQNTQAQAPQQQAVQQETEPDLPF